MKKFWNCFVVCLIALMSLSFTSCHLAECPPDSEIIFIKHPLLFGQGGVQLEPLTEGSEWAVFSTEEFTCKVVPVKFEETLDDIISNENTPLDFNTSIFLKVKNGKSPILLKNYGSSWYANNIRETYMNMTRHYVSQYSPFDLTSNRETIAQIDSAVLAGMREYVKSLDAKQEFPIEVVSVITGRAIPNQAQLQEMNNTAAQIQAKITQDRAKEMQESRRAAEEARALADQAYQKKMGLSPDQYIQLKAWDIIEKKNGANIDVLFGTSGTNQMWNIRR